MTSNQENLEFTKQFVTTFFTNVSENNLTQLKTYFEKLEGDIASQSHSFFSETKNVTQLIDLTFEGKHRNCMHFAAARGDVEVFKFINDKYHPNIGIRDQQHHTPLLTAIRHKNKDLVKYLIEQCQQNLNQNNEGRAGPLHIAASNNDVEMITLLIEKGADIEQKSDFANPLNCAVGSGHVQSALLLLEKGANPDGDLQSPFPPPLILAVDFQNQVLYNKLIEKGANIKIHDPHGYTVLQLASEKGNLKLVDYLVSNGLEPNYQCHGKTALYLALQNDKWEVVEYLRKYQKNFKALEQKINAIKLESPQGLTPQQITTKSNEFKQQGNKLFNEKKYDQSITKYSQAIKIDPKNHIFYSNRAASYLILQDFENALLDATKAKQINPKHSKSIYREAQAYVGLKNYVQAAASYWQASRLQPNSQQLLANFKKYAQLAKQQN